MPLTLEVVTAERDFDSILPVLYAAFGEPFNSLRRWFIPVHTTVEEALESAKQRTIKHWREHDNITWLKVVDTESGEIIGAAEWEVREHVDPTPEPQAPITAYWHREGSEEKDFAGKLVTELKGFMKERMTRPHIELEQLVVHPEHRRRGAARLLLDWGIAKADELGVETCVESVPFAAPVYERFGFAHVDTLNPNLAVESATPEWQGFLKDDLRVFSMWRPVDHAYRAGEDKAPWL